MAVKRHEVTHSAYPLVDTYTGDGIEDFDAAGGESIVLLIDYTKGDETLGIDFRIRHKGIGTSALYSLAEATGSVWTASADQRIDPPSGASIQLAIPFVRVAGSVEISVKFAGTSAAAPGSVTIEAISSDERG